MRKTNMTFLTKSGYAALVVKAKEFVQILISDAGYEKPAVNKVALESMLVGWLRGTPRWKAYQKYCDEWYPRENLYLLAQDQAIQAANDAILSGEDSIVTWFNTISELQEMVARPTAEELALSEGATLCLAVERAKRRLGITI